MGTSKKLLEFNRLVAVADSVACYCVLSGQDYYFYLSDLVTYINSEQSNETTATCLNNATTNINLGAAIDNKRIEVSYIAKRDTKYRISTITLITDGSTIACAEYPFITIPNTETDDLGISFACDISSSQARLNVTLTDDTDNASFKYSFKTMDV